MVMYAGRQHEDAVRVRYSLAQALSAASRLDLKTSEEMDEAVSLHEKNLEILKTNDRHPKATGSKSQDPKDRSALEVKHNYAGVLYHLKPYEKSKHLLLQIQNAVLLLTVPEQREMDSLTQSVDRYLAACIEATNDVSLGVSRVVASVLKRTQDLPDSRREDPTSTSTFPDRPNRRLSALEGPLWLNRLRQQGTAKQTRQPPCKLGKWNRKSAKVQQSEHPEQCQQ